MVERSAEVGQHFVKCGDLGGVARVAIKNPAVGTVFLGQTILDDLVGQGIRNQLALIGVAHRFKTEFGLVLDVVAEDIAGGDGGDVEVLSEQRSLGAFAHALRSHDEQTHGGLLLCWKLIRLWLPC